MSPTKKIEKLPPEIEAALPAIRDEWLAVGLFTAPADRAEAERGAMLAYEAAGLARPEIVIWLDSPFAGCLGAALLSATGKTQVGAQVRDQVWAQVGDQVRAQVGAQVRDQVWAQVWAQVGRQVWAQVRDQVGRQVWAQVGDQVWAQVWAQVGAQVRDQVWAQVWDQVRDQVWDQVGAQVGAQVWAQVWAQVRAQVRDQVGAQVGAQVWAQVRAQVRDQVGAQVRDQVWAQVRDQVGGQVRDQASRAVYGQHESGWLAWVDTFRRAGVPNLERVEGLALVAHSAGWWWPFKGAVILTDRPERLERDERGRLHSEAGPAIRYRDGWGIYAVHGVRVEPWIIDNPEQITAEKITKEENMEVRRVMLERYGAGRYLLDIKAEVLDASDYGTLYRAPMGEDEPLVMVKLVNSTPEPDGSFKDYWLRVNPECRPLLGMSDDGQPILGEPQEMRARNAVAASFGLRGDEYIVEVQT